MGPKNKEYSLYKKDLDQKSGFRVKVRKRENLKDIQKESSQVFQGSPTLKLVPKINISISFFHFQEKVFSTRFI
ncbi:unnamed protein product (macronuclear) [Paramecium tetraurelia]|uniref:Uncharacterized protein n=1 Tax=Paramecium tetraurelia TaxID=5888 RepID=A0D1C1_PARTE|nr:uncharacterized protein GSPATT00012362001 [Paramecium tetraurelia]CAK76838.1 unnamed protein product [Paramecium tetraurelia]|eukprot:XP_001444235.1 hypothetical protein (macronuclear) [Paramecium tetraurelia strain d4-2]